MCEVRNVFTIIFLDSHAATRMAPYSFLFRPFELQGRLAMCHWDEEGTTLESAVGQLAGLLEGKTEWRALVVHSDALDDTSPRPAASRLNPFDYSESDTETGPHESPVPLIRLTHILCGFPPSPRMEFEEGYAYYDEALGREVRVARSEMAAQTGEDGEDVVRQFALRHDVPTEMFKPVFVEKPPSPEEREALARLCAQYPSVVVRPSEVLLLGWQRAAEDEEKRRMGNSWNTRRSEGASFCEQNQYPETCRFLVSVMHTQDAGQFERDMMSFWNATLTLALNRVPSAYLQAYRLYRVGVEFDRAVLDDMLSAHLQQLSKARMMVQGELDKEPVATFAKTETLVPTQHVPVVIEQDDERSLFEDVERSPHDEPTEDEQARQIEEKKKKTNENTRDPRRAIDRAAQFLRLKSRRFLDQGCELDEVQTEHLAAFIRDLEARTLSMRPKNRYDAERFKQVAQSVDTDVARKASHSMSSHARHTAFVIASLIVLFGFAPYLWYAFKRHDAMPVAACVLTIGLVAATLLGGYAALRISQKKELDIIDQCMNPIKECEEAVLTTRNEYDTYFTNICTLMKAYSMQTNAHQSEDEMTRTRRVLKQHLSAMDHAIERDLKWFSAFEIPRLDAENESSHLAFDMQTVPSDNPIYYLSPCQEGDIIPLNHSGDCVGAPYGFVHRLTIEHDELLEPTI